MRLTKSKNNLQLLETLLCFIIYIYSIVFAYAGDIRGQWDFENDDLSATVGKDLEYFGDITEMQTLFGTSLDFKIPAINNGVARVMKFPACTGKMGFKMFTDSNPNGGGTFVNQYTLIMDILFPKGTENNWRAIYQANAFNRSGNDSELYVSNENALGIEGNYEGTINTDTWYRIAITVDLARSSGPLMEKFINGEFVGSQRLTYAVDDRWSLYAKTENSPILLFTEPLGTNTQSGYVNSIQFRDYAMTREEIASLGGPSAQGISSLTAAKKKETPVDKKLITGQWEFNYKDFKASAGYGLAYIGKTEFNKPAIFGKTNDLEVSDIAGEAASVIKVPKYESNYGIKCFNGLTANGGGARVNKYSLIMDILIPEESNSQYKGLLQTNTDNSDDVDFAISQENGLGTLGQYSEGLNTNTWYRIALSVDLTSSKSDQKYRIYKDGQSVKFIDLASDGNIDGRYSLGDSCLLFTDDNDETAVVFINSIQFRNYALSDEEAKSLGQASAQGIPKGSIDTLPVKEIPAEEFESSEVTINWNTYMNGINFMATQKLPGLVLFVDPDIANSNNMETILSSSKLTNILSKFVLIKVSVKEDKDLAQQYSVYRVPTILILDQNKGTLLKWVPKKSELNDFSIENGLKAYAK